MRAAIAGAGIAGLAAAIALAQRGWSVDIYERSDRVEDAGAGIQLSPNATTVLDRLGVINDIRASLCEPQAVALHDAPSGAFLNRVPWGEIARRRYGAPYAVIRRSDLHSGLLAAAARQPGITVRLGAGVVGVGDSGDRIMFWAGGEACAADVLVAADGIHSRLRTGYFGHPGPTRLRKAAWRATLPVEAVPRGVARDVTGLWMGPGGHLVHYPLRGGTEMNLVVVAALAERTRPPVEAFGETCRRLMDAAAEWRCWELLENDTTPNWVRGGVVLIGDAAHGMSPSAAQGGAQAIEDSWVLAQSLAAQPESPRGALTCYEQSRRPRVGRVARQSRRNLALYELGGVAATVRNLGIRALSQTAHLARLDWLYGWKPPPEKA